MTAPSIGIKDLLVAASLGTFNTPPSGSWPIFVSKLPAEPDQCIAIYDTGGQDPDPKWLLQYPNVVIMARGKGFVDVNAKMRNICSKLQGLSSQDINGDRWVSLVQQGDIVHAGHDEKDRMLLTATFRLIIEPATDAYTNREPL